MASRDQGWSSDDLILGERCTARNRHEGEDVQCGLVHDRKDVTPEGHQAAHHALLNSGGVVTWNWSTDTPRLQGKPSTTAPLPGPEPNHKSAASWHPSALCRPEDLPPLRRGKAKSKAALMIFGRQ